MPLPWKASSITPRVWLIAGVLLLSVVLIAGGVWAFAAVKNSYFVTGTTPVDESARAYRQGVSALSADQTGTAVALLEEAVKLDPANSQAKSALASATASASGGSGDRAVPAKPGGNSGGSSPTKPGAVPAPVGPAPVKVAPDSVWLTRIDPVKLLPPGFGGYTMGQAQLTGQNDASVGGQPRAASAPAGAITWRVRDSQSQAEAAAVVSAYGKSKFSHGSTPLIVNGVNAYYGADGAGSAVVAYTRGRYVFEVVVIAKQPAISQDVAENAAAAFVTNP
jgi:hypothetical protein